MGSILSNGVLQFCFTNYCEAGLEQVRVLPRAGEEGSFISPPRPTGSGRASAAPTSTERPWTEDVCDRGKVLGMHAHGLMSACVNARVCACSHTHTYVSVHGRDVVGLSQSPEEKRRTNAP